MKKWEGKYIGPDKIEKASLSSEKTYLGKPKVDIVYEGAGIKPTRAIPLEVLEAIVTKKPIDLTELREKRTDQVLEKILGVLVESELTKPDIEYVTGSSLSRSLNHSLSRAKKILWGKDFHEITLMDIEKILRRKK